LTGSKACNRTADCPTILPLLLNAPRIEAGRPQAAHKIDQTDRIIQVVVLPLSAKHRRRIIAQP